MDKPEIIHQLQLFIRALASLNEATNINHPSQIEKDGTIQRFEYTVEIAWKTIRRFLIYKGENLDGMYPKDILKLAWERGLIDNREDWLSYIDIRNRLSHTYDESVADKYYPDVCSSIGNFDNLKEKIQSAIGN